MSSLSISVDILARLRHETRAVHEALEQLPFNQALGNGTITEALTRQFLARLYGFVAPFEAQLQSKEELLGPAWELPRRYRAQLLRQDLPDTGTLPLVPELPPLATRAQLLGAMYVLEGSTLGGQVIARQLAKAGIPARAYFSGHAEQTGPLWKTFVGLLTQAATPDNADDIVASASLTFQRLHAWLEQAQP
ncbi:biliverdin-producing heme oxygenase [Hymenobacter glacieicola]|uniref:Heme oxygenase n=1 Tax=Hymenobacter glacieicola TaxID=1562124 RepID=A0ABQ1WJV0_9BACT|nr:biliverdin-producing heme oxygenase [Hymenobacter glacieicola]GGG31740.1 heme oxygenase [Hymenobacter glacieicola]